MPSVKDIPDLTDEEEARIQAGIARDPDNPELTDEQIAAMRPAREVLPPELYAALIGDKAKRDREGLPTQELVTIPLDRIVLDHFRAAGPEWPNRINEVLKRSMGASLELGRER